jgi:DNA (cytosine-5)-methyltransferase 1
VTFGSLFAGIGGIDLGLERAGMTCKWQVEIDPWCRQVLAKHWPDVRRYEDVKAVGGDTLEPVELIAGGFPCQDVSVAGQGAGIKDGTRSGLWSEFHRIIRELRPRYVLVENVPGLFANGMGRVLGDLAEIGYDAEWEVLSAADVGAPHLRKRVFIVAYSEGDHAEQSAIEPRHKPCGKNSQSIRADFRSKPARCGANVADAISNATGATYRSSGRDSEQRWDDESVGQRDTVGSHTGDGSAEVADAQGSGLQGSTKALAFNEKTGRGRTGQSSRGIARKQVAVADTRSQRLQGTKFRYDNDAEAGRGKTGTTGAAAECCGNEGRHWAVEPDVGRVANGVPQRVDRLKGLGNAVVPQCAEQIGRRIMEQRGH